MAASQRRPRASITRGHKPLSLSPEASASFRDPTTSQLAAFSSPPAPISVSLRSQVAKRALRILGIRCSNSWAALLSKPRRGRPTVPLRDSGTGACGLCFTVGKIGEEGSWVLDSERVLRASAVRGSHYVLCQCPPPPVVAQQHWRSLALWACASPC